MRETLTVKERFRTALSGGVPDRLPVTTHHLMPYFLDRYLRGISSDEFFERFGLDPIVWTVPHRPDPARAEFPDPEQGATGFLESRRSVSESWRIASEPVAAGDYPSTRYTIATPSGELTTVLQENAQTTWVAEHLIKQPAEIEIVAKHATSPLCDVDAVNETAAAYDEDALIRGHVACFDIYGQPGCWQDACCLVGTDRLILATFDDPAWVHELLQILLERKLRWTRSLAGANYDILELGGGDASTTVISPAIFEEFVAPYDSRIIEAAHEAGQRIVYHTCGGMMPILETIAAMQPDAMETFTPPAMGGDARLAEARRRLPREICMIGGFDQYHSLLGCSEEETRAEVRRCFELAGREGGYIVATSDHFFDAEPRLIAAYADEARTCDYRELGS